MLEHGNDDPDAGPEMDPGDFLDQAHQPIQPLPPHSTQEELQRWVNSIDWERYIDDPSDERVETGAMFRDSGHSAVTSEGYALVLASIFGPERTSIYGYNSSDNPEGLISQDHDGTDFAVVDKRYIIDPWLNCVENYSTQTVFDLTSERDREAIRKLYGNRLRWKHSST